MNKKSRRGSIEIISGVLLIAAALILTGRNMWEVYQARAASDEIMSKMRTEIREDCSLTGEKEDIPPDYVINPNVEMPVKTVEGTDYIAMLSIPSLKLELPVAKYWSYDTLRGSPCRYAGTVYLKNMVIAAHNYDSHFGRLYTLKRGDSVELKDMDGNHFRYEVMEIISLRADAVRDMTESDYDLTLFTCTSGGYSRLAVRCMLT